MGDHWPGSPPLTTFWKALGRVLWGGKNMYSEPRSKEIACSTYNCICSESTLNGRLLVTWARKVSLEGPRASLLIGKFPAAGWEAHVIWKALQPKAPTRAKAALSGFLHSGIPARVGFLHFSHSCTWWIPALKGFLHLEDSCTQGIPALGGFLHIGDSCM